MKPFYVAYAHSQDRRRWYRADVFDAWKPSYVGATLRTRYYERGGRDGREYREISYYDMPKSVYQKLRRAIVVEIAKKYPTSRKKTRS